LVDGHSPRIALVLELLRVHRQHGGPFLLLHLLREFRVLLVLRLRSDAHQIATFERPVVLRAGQVVGVARLVNSTPPRMSGATMVRSVLRLNPVPLPARPALVRPYPR